MAKSARSKSKKAFRDIKKNKVEESALYVENTLRKDAALAQAVASGQAAREQGMAVEQPSEPFAAPEADGSGAMEVDPRPLSFKHDKKLKLKLKGKKGQKKGQKPRNPLNISFQKSNTKLSKAKSFKKKNHRKH